jgi:hypothetical protein
MIIAELQYSVVASGLGGALFPYLYEEIGEWVLSPKPLPQERRSWKDDLYDYPKESIEPLFQRINQALGLKERQVKGEGRNGAFVLAILCFTSFTTSRITVRASLWLVSKIIWIALDGVSQVVDCHQL